VCSAKSRAVSLAAQLTALAGHSAHIEEFTDRIRVRITLPAHLTDPRRHALLATLADADRYGHDVTAERSVVWAEVDGDGVSDGGAAQDPTTTGRDRS
jgi:hypothetical protein